MRGRRDALPWIGGGLALLAVAAGVLIPVKRTPPAAIVPVPAMKGVSLTMPADWHRAAPPAALPGLRLAGARAYGPGGHATETALVVGRAASAPPPTLLPDSFVSNAAVRVPPARGIAIGPADALLYAGVVVPAARQRVDLYVVPAGGQVYAVECRASPSRAAAFMPACRTAAQSLTLPAVQTAQVSALDPAFGRAVGVALTRLRAQRRAGRRHLARADSGAGQAAAALALTAAYRTAAGRVRSAARLLSTNGAQGKAARGAREPGLASALDRAAGSYRRLASASAHRRTADFRRARSAAIAAERVVERQLNALAALGYHP